MPAMRARRRGNCKLATVGKFLLAMSLCGPHFAYAQCQGGLDAAGLGQVFVSGGGITPAGNTLTVNHYSGISLTTSCTDHWDPHAFTTVNLLGKTLSFEVDLSKVGCACNLAFYLTKEPAMSPAGEPSEGSCDYSPYYCDANQVCGQWCPELDIMEANSHTFQSTPHKCDPSNDASYYNCDRGGAAMNIRSMGNNVYGPGAQYRIDTTRPFEVRTSFSGDPNAPSFTGMKTELVQGSNVLSWDNSAGPGYLGSMAGAMGGEGMAIRITYWGKEAQTMAWLDNPFCGSQTCEGANTGPATISNIKVFPIGSEPPIIPAPTAAPPVPPPATTPAPQEEVVMVTKSRAIPLILGGIGLFIVAYAADSSRGFLEEKIRDLLRRNAGGGGRPRRQGGGSTEPPNSTMEGVIFRMQDCGAGIVKLGSHFVHFARTYAMAGVRLVREQSRQGSSNHHEAQAILKQHRPNAVAMQLNDIVRVVPNAKIRSFTAGHTARVLEMRLLMEDRRPSCRVLVEFTGGRREELSAPECANLEVEDSEREHRNGQRCVITTIILATLLALLGFKLV